MKRIVAMGVLCLALTGCKTEEQRAHERHVQDQQHHHELQLDRQRLQAQTAMDRERTLSQERLRSQRIEAVSDRVKQFILNLAMLLGLGLVCATVFAALVNITETLKKRLEMLREVRLRAEAERTERYRHFVLAVTDPNNGLSDEMRYHALESASKEISGYLTYDPGTGS